MEFPTPPTERTTTVPTVSRILSTSNVSLGRLWQDAELVEKTTLDTSSSFKDILNALTNSPSASRSRLNLGLNSFGSLNNMDMYFGSQEQLMQMQTTASHDRLALLDNGNSNNEDDAALERLWKDNTTSDQAQAALQSVVASAMSSTTTIGTTLNSAGLIANPTSSTSQKVEWTFGSEAADELEVPSVSAMDTSSLLTSPTAAVPTWDLEQLWSLNESATPPQPPPQQFVVTGSADAAAAPTVAALAAPQAVATTTTTITTTDTPATQWRSAALRRPRAASPAASEISATTSYGAPFFSSTENAPARKRSTLMGRETKKQREARFRDIDARRQELEHNIGQAQGLINETLKLLSDVWINPPSLKLV